MDPQQRMLLEVSVEALDSGKLGISDQSHRAFQLTIPCSWN